MDDSIEQQIVDSNRFYDEGWNAYVRGYAYRPFAALDWRDGWKDAASAKLSDLVEI